MTFKSLTLTRSTAIILFLVVSALTLPLVCSRHHTPEERADWIAKRIAKKLDLTEEQCSKLDALKVEMLRARQHVHDARWRDEVMAQIDQDRLDEPKLLALFDEHQRRQREAAPLMLVSRSQGHIA